MQRYVVWHARKHENPTARRERRQTRTFEPPVVENIELGLFELVISKLDQDGNQWGINFSHGATYSSRGTMLNGFDRISASVASGTVGLDTVDGRPDLKYPLRSYIRGAFED